MNKFRPIGRWVALKTNLSEKTTTISGIEYTEKQIGKYIISKVIAIGSDITEDIKLGDTVYWDPKESKGTLYDGMHIVHEKCIAIVDR